MTDQPGLFDLPEPEPAHRRPVRGRSRETFVRAVTAEIILSDRDALQQAAAAQADVVVIGVVDPSVGDDDPLEEIGSNPAVALEWCIEPTAGLGMLLESGVAHLTAASLAVTEPAPGRLRAEWSVQLKLHDAPLLRELAQALCPDDDARVEVDRSLAAAWARIADPYAPISAVPGIRWKPGTVSVNQVFARARPGADSPVRGLRRSESRGR